MDEKLKQFVTKYAHFKETDKIKDTTLESIEKELFKGTKDQLIETKDEVQKWNPDVNSSKLLSAIEESTKCLGTVRKFMENMQVDKNAKFKILRDILPLVTDIGKESLTIACEATRKRSKCSKQDDKGTLGRSLGHLSIASVGLLNGIVRHDTMTSFLEGKTFDFLKKEEVNECRARIQTRCFSLCKDIIDTLCGLFEELAFNEKRCSREFKLFLDAANCFMKCLADLMAPIRDIVRKTEIWKKEASTYREACCKFYHLSYRVQFFLRSLCDSTQVKATKKPLPQKRMSSWCLQKERERNQVSNLVTTSPIPAENITSGDLDKSFYWIQIFAKESWNNFSCGDILCRPQEMFLSNRVRMDAHEKTIEDDVKVFMKEVRADEEDEFTKDMSREGVDEIMAMFEVVGRMEFSKTRTVSFSLTIGYNEKLVNVCCKHSYKGKWSNTVEMTKQSDLLYTAEVRAMEKIIIFSSFPGKTEEISPEGTTVSLYEMIQVQYPKGCVKKKTKITHKLHPVHRSREEEYKETYPEIYGGIHLSETLSLEYSGNLKFQKEVRITFNMPVRPNEQVSLFEITKREDNEYGLLKQDIMPNINKNDISFHLSDPKSVVCVTSTKEQTIDDGRSMECQKDKDDSNERSGPTSDSSNTAAHGNPDQNLTGAQVAISKPPLATSKSTSRKTLPKITSVANKTTDKSVHESSAEAVHTGGSKSLTEENTRVSKDGRKISLIDKLRVLLGFASKCCFILSYKKQDDAEKPTEVRLDCLESLKSHIEDRLDSLKMREWVRFRCIVDPDTVIVGKGKKLRLDIDGNLDLIGKTEVAVIFKYLIESPMNFRVKLKSRDPNEVDSLAFLYFRRASGKHITCCVIDTNELLGQPVLQVSTLLTDTSKIQDKATEDKNLYAVYDHLSYGTDDTERFLSFLGIHAPKNVKRTPAENKELLRVRFKEMKKERVDKAFYVLMDALGVINRKDVRLLLMKHVIRRKILYTPGNKGQRR